MAPTTSSTLAFTLTIALAVVTGSSAFAAIGGRGNGNQGSSPSASHASTAAHPGDVADYDVCVNRCPPRHWPRPQVQSSRCSETLYRGARIECRREGDLR